MNSSSEGFVCLIEAKSVELGQDRKLHRAVHESLVHNELEFPVDGAADDTYVFLPGGGIRGIHPHGELKIAQVGDVAAAFQGTMTNTAALADRYAVGGTSSPSAEAEIVCRMFSDLGLNMVTAICGSYSYCLYDSKTMRVLAARSPACQLPVLQGRTEHGSLVISSGGYLPEGCINLVELKAGEYKYGWHALPRQFTPGVEPRTQVYIRAPSHGHGPHGPQTDRGHYGGSGQRQRLSLDMPKSTTAASLARHIANASNGIGGSSVGTSLERRRSVDYPGLGALLRSPGNKHQTLPVVCSLTDMPLSPPPQLRFTGFQVANGTAATPPAVQQLQRQGSSSSGGTPLATPPKPKPAAGHAVVSDAAATPAPVAAATAPKALEKQPNSPPSAASATNKAMPRAAKAVATHETNSQQPAAAAKRTVGTAAAAEAAAGGHTPEGVIANGRHGKAQRKGAASDNRRPSLDQPSQETGAVKRKKAAGGRGRAASADGGNYVVARGRRIAGSNGQPSAAPAPRGRSVAERSSSSKTTTAAAATAAADEAVEASETTAALAARKVRHRSRRQSKLRQLQRQAAQNGVDADLQAQQGGDVAIAERSESTDSRSSADSQQELPAVTAAVTPATAEPVPANPVQEQVHQRNDQQQQQLVQMVELVQPRPFQLQARGSSPQVSVLGMRRIGSCNSFHSLGQAATGGTTVPSAVTGVMPIQEQVEHVTPVVPSFGVRRSGSCNSLLSVGRTGGLSAAFQALAC